MSIRQFESVQLKAPFLGKPHYPISGLDQLGLNLTSERIFDLLLPGLNNVTQRIRYYSFYCWFFDWYSQTIRTTSKSKQNKYLRRAEFLLALVAAHNKAQGVPGISKAESVYEVSDNLINLVLGTNEGASSEGSYWKNTRGVLGQYYISSIKQMGILVDQGDINGLYVRTDFEHETKISGKALAHAFEQNTINSKHIFFDAVENNCISKDNIEIISKDFDMLDIPDNTIEQDLLWKLFTGVDQAKENTETFYRKETIKLLLSNVSTHNKEDRYNQLNVPLTIYANQWKEEFSMTEKLWYFFILEQFWSVACTGCLDGFINILEEESKNNWIDEISLIENIKTKVGQLIEEDNYNIVEDTFTTIDDKNLAVVELVENSKVESDPYLKIKYALYAIGKLFKENNLSRKELLEISKKNKIHTPSSFLVTYEDLKIKQDLPIIQFVGYFLTRYVINRHHYVALRKLNATQNSAKFYREDGMIRLVDTFNYDYSSPRIHTLIDFMKDLSLIEPKSTTLTTKGKNYLKQLA